MVASIKECAFIATILPSCFSVKLASAWTFPSSKLLKSPCTHRRFLHHYDESSLLTQGQCYPSRRIDVHQFNCRSKLSRATGRGAKGVVPATFMSTTSLHLSIASSSQEDHNDVSSTTVLGAMGLNELQTLLRESVKIEDYPRAAKIRDAIADKLSSASSSSSSLVNPNEADEEPLRGGTSATGDGNGDAVVMKQRPSRRQRRHLSWKGLGTAPWLVERLEALGYNMPTTIQINAFESINSMLLRDVKVVSGVRNGGGGNSSISSFASSSDVGGRAEEPSATLEELITERDRLISNSIIADTKLSNDISHHDKENEITRASNKNEGNNENNMAVIVSGSTGSGKTLAYAVPMLSTLSESLFRRQRIRVKAEEDITDATNDLLSRVAVTTSPEVRGQGRKQVGGIRNDSSRGDDTGSTNFIHGYSDDETGIKSATLGKSGNDVKSPMALIVVPTRELGVQTAMNVYELIGGSTRRASPIDYFGGSKANMFKFKGPRGVKIACILDPVEAETGLKLQTDIAITTPQFLSRLLDEGDVIPNKLRVIVFDEADLALEQTKSNDLQRLFYPLESTGKAGKNKKTDETDDDDEDVDQEEAYLNQKSRLTCLVGASVTEALKDAEGIVTKEGSILPKDHTYLATATSFAPIAFDDDTECNNKRDDPNNDAVDYSIVKAKATSLKELRLQLDPGLIHERVLAPNNTGLLCLCRMLRKELRDFSNGAATTTNLTSVTAGAQLHEQKEWPQQPPPRVIIFFPSESDARKSMPKLRDAMWGDYKLSVLLPNTGVNPLSVMDDFQNNRTSVLLATPNSIRGLDFVNVTHVYTLYLPSSGEIKSSNTNSGEKIADDGGNVGDIREYIHLAGRVGRIGQLGSIAGRGGRVTSILQPEEAGRMDELSTKLNFDFVDIEFAKSAVTAKPTSVVLQEEDGDDEAYVWKDDDVGNAIDKKEGVEEMRRYLEDIITLVGDDVYDNSSVDSQGLDKDE